MKKNYSFYHSFSVCPFLLLSFTLLLQRKLHVKKFGHFVLHVWQESVFWMGLLTLSNTRQAEQTQKVTRRKRNNQTINLQLAKCGFYKKKKTNVNDTHFNIVVVCGLFSCFVQLAFFCFSPDLLKFVVIIIHQIEINEFNCRLDRRSENISKKTKTYSTILEMHT